MEEELNEIKKQFDELMAKAEEIVKKNEKDDEPKRWRAECGKEYYSIVTSGFTACKDTDDYTAFDDSLYKAGNYFKSEEEAEKAAQHFKDYLILRADAKGYEPKKPSVWAHCYYVFWSGMDSCLKTLDDGGCLSGTIYFENEKDAEASIEKHGDIWKRYLGVEG